jgi:hypothetical protein
MKRKLPLAIIPLAVLLAVVLVLRNDAPVASTAAMSSESHLVGASGMRLYVDPNTGEFLEAPPEGVQVQMSQEEMAPFSTSESGLFEEDAPGGGKMVNLRGRFQEAFTARVDQSGAVTYECSRRDDAGAKDSGSEKEGK